MNPLIIRFETQRKTLEQVRRSEIDRSTLVVEMSPDVIDALIFADGGSFKLHDQVGPKEAWAQYRGVLVEPVKGKDLMVVRRKSCWMNV